MGFEIFMMICNLLIPLVMIIAGRLMFCRPPEKINEINGYRTSRSRKNQDTWKFAQKYCGILWWRIGWIMLVLASACSLLTLGKGETVLGIGAVVTESVECAVLLLSIMTVEKALKRTFDEEGNRKDCK